MSAHKYILEPYRGMKTRFICPSCNSNDRSFTRYIDIEACEYINANVGRCDKESSCGYHYTPKQYFSDNVSNTHLINATNNGIKPKGVAKSLTLDTSYISTEVFKASLTSHTNNNFVKYLIQLLGVELASLTISKYFIGTSKHWENSTVFWQIDKQGKIRTGKIMLYNALTGKRSKEPNHKPTWAHSLLRVNDFTLKQCLFGEHLLNMGKNHVKPVAIVESEKTAIISSAYLPQFIWMATGSLNNLNTEKCEVLKGRNVILFPDLGAGIKWNEKANDLSKFCNVSVSKLLENGATDEERKKGLDLADYLVKFKLTEFSESIKKEGFSQVNNAECSFARNGEPDNQFVINSNTQVIGELTEFFKNSTLPTTSLKFGIGVISDLPLFIDSHLCVVQANKGSPISIPYLNRLIQLKQLLNT